MTFQTYSYNPHQHTKIWLSNNPELFMNLENQIRLIKMRETNPHDQIHLIYDASLLTLRAIDALMVFCKEHSILPINADKFKNQLKSDNERQLFCFYQDEIQHLSEGGNLAVASDILRWLSPVYALGTYSDFDFPIDTSALPNQIKVAVPLLLNIGSLKLGKQEFVFVNNDYVAIVNEAAAREELSRVQQGIIQILTKYHTDFFDQIEKKFKKTFFNRLLLRSLKNRSETFYIRKSKEIVSARPLPTSRGLSVGSGILATSLDPTDKPWDVDRVGMSEPLQEINNALSSRGIRNFIRQIMSDTTAFIDFNKKNPKETTEEVIHKLRNNLCKQLHPIKYLFFKKEYTEIQQILKQNDNELLNYLMKKELNLYLKSIIVCTTGPIKISKALFDGYLFDIHEFSQKIQPYSFNTYTLQKSFQSQNSIPLHENPLGMLIFLGKSEGEVNDSSWLESGRKLQEIRVNALKEKQKEFALNLPCSLLKIREDIEKQVTKSFTSQKEVLEQVLKCFREDNAVTEFDTKQFKTILGVHGFKNKFFPKFTLNNTQKLLRTLSELTNNAIIYSLTTDRKIKF